MVCARPSSASIEAALRNMEPKQGSRDPVKLSLFVCARFPDAMIGAARRSKKCGRYCFGSGAVFGWASPRWQVKQLTCIFPSENSALIFWAMPIILRAAIFLGFSSLA